jgi:hypothetical protein
LFALPKPHRHVPAIGPSTSDTVVNSHLPNTTLYRPPLRCLTSGFLSLRVSSTHNLANCDRIDSSDTEAQVVQSMPVQNDRRSRYPTKSLRYVSDLRIRKNLPQVHACCKRSDDSSDDQMNRQFSASDGLTAQPNWADHRIVRDRDVYARHDQQTI